MQTFIDRQDQEFVGVDFLPGSDLAMLFEPVPGGSIHRLNMRAGTVIPRHRHPADEYVYVLSGTIETGGRTCHAGTAWKTPADTDQGPHRAVSDVEILTIRLGGMGEFETS